MQMLAFPTERLYIFLFLQFCYHRANMYVLARYIYIFEFIVTSFARARCVVRVLAARGGDGGAAWRRARA